MDTSILSPAQRLAEQYVYPLVKPQYLPYTCFGVIALIAFFLRFWGLGEFPDALYRDETWNGVEGLLTAQNWEFLPFYEGSTGREGLLIWLIALVHTVFDPSVQAVRIAPASVGFVTVLVFPFCAYYLMRFFLETSARQKIDADQQRLLMIIALAIMFFLATSYWHVNFSRITFRAILDPLFSMLACTLVALSYQFPKKYWLPIGAGIVCGLGLYGYGAFKFMVFPLAFIFFYSAYHYRTKVIIPTIILAVVALAVAYPLFNYILHNSDNYFLRLNQVSIFRKSDPLAEFFDGLHKLINMLWSQGDRNLRHNTNKNAQLNTLALIFLVLGIYHMFKHWWINKDATRGYRLLSVFVLLWFLVMLVPSALTYDAQPHALRAIGMVVPIMIFAGFGAGIMLREILNYSPRAFRQQFCALVGVTMVFVTADTATEFFVRYQQHPGMKNWFDYKTNEAAKEILRDNGKNSYLVVVENRRNPETYSVIQTFRYLTNFKMDAKRHRNIIRVRDLKNHPLKDRATIFTPHKLEREVKRTVRNASKVKRY